MEPRLPPILPDEKPRGSVQQPLLINGGLMLLLYAGAYLVTNGKLAETAYAYFFALVGLFIVNVLATIILAFMGRSRTVMGCIYSGIGIFLIGLGSCAITLTHISGGH